MPIPLVTGEKKRCCCRVARHWSTGASTLRRRRGRQSRWALDEDEQGNEAESGQNAVWLPIEQFPGDHMLVVQLLVANDALDR